MAVTNILKIMGATTLLSATSNDVGMNLRLVGYGLSISRYQGIYIHASGNCVFQAPILTMPSFNPADALIKAADNLVDTINGIMPKNKVTSDAVEQLMEIYQDTGRESNMRSTNSKGALGTSASSKGKGTKAGGRTRSKPPEHPNIIT